MKIFKIIIPFFILVITASCGNDDDAAPVDRDVINLSNLVGTYNVVAFSATATETDTGLGRTDIVTTEVTGSNFNNTTVTFTNQNSVLSSGSYTLTAVYTEDGIIDTEVSTETLPFTGGFSLVENNLFIPSLEVDIATIENFSETGFTLSFSEESIDTDYSYILNGSFLLERQ